MSKKIKHIQLFESFTLNNKVFYHGSRTELPFKNFEKRMDGSGIVTVGGGKYGGFFFTDNKDNAEFYTEYFICQVHIKNLKLCSPNEKNPSTILKKGIEENINYIISDILDGHAYSDVAVVPHSNLDDIAIIGWEFIGDKKSYFQSLNKMFGRGVTKSRIDDFISMTGGGLEYLLSIPIFKKYYDSKNDY